MKNIHLSFIAVALLSTTACTQDPVLDKAPGTYQHQTKSTDANGVTTEHKTVTDVGYDADGRKTAVVKSKTTKKPPGLINGWLNKRTSESTDVIQEK